MINEQLKESIADHGIEESLMAMLKLIQEGYLMPFYEKKDVLPLREILNHALVEWQARQKYPTTVIKDFNSYEQQ